MDLVKLRSVGEEESSMLIEVKVPAVRTEGHAALACKKVGEAVKRRKTRDNETSRVVAA
jgi:hypothetical protein